MRIAAAALRMGRAQAEALMEDECIITADGARVWNATTGQYDEGERPVVYTGPCRFVMANRVPTTDDGPGQVESVQALQVSLPVPTSTAVRPGHRLTWTVSPNDPAAVGQVFKVVGDHAQTHATARRLPIERYSAS